MKQRTIGLLVLGLAAGVWAADDTALIQTPRGKMSYGLGMDIGRNITNQQIQVEAEALAAGLKAILTGAKPLLTDEEMQEALNNLRAELQAKRVERAKQQAERVKTQAEQAKKDGEAFLAENKKKEGVITLPSGLQYKVYAQGSGPKPSSSDTVTTHYRGTFIDGKEFDSSYRTGGPVSFKVNEVIKGWQEALQLMSVGSKWRLFIPPHLAYGEAGHANIPPNSTLIFDLELLGIATTVDTHKPGSPSPAK